MSKPPYCYLVSLILLHTLFTVCNGVSVPGLEGTDFDEIMSRSKRIGESFEEAEMESDISRRLLLMAKKYISYETLKRDMVPCDKPGASYYSCHAGQANPYSRGCEMITRCRGH